MVQHTHEIHRYLCGYYKDGRTATGAYLPAVIHNKIVNYRGLLEQGYCRDGNFYFCNLCQGCNECRGLRVRVNEFKPTKSQRRVLNKNKDIEIRFSNPAVITAEKVELYQRFLKERHGREMEIFQVESLIFCFHLGYPLSFEMDYYLSGKLVGVGIIDDSDGVFSSHYFYFDPSLKDRSLGTFSMLKELELAKSTGNPYHYLGFYLSEIPAMNYKRKFQPAEIFDGEKWVELRNED